MTKELVPMFPSGNQSASLGEECKIQRFHGEMFLGCIFQGRNKASIVVGVTEDKVKNLDLLGLESF